MILFRSKEYLKLYSVHPFFGHLYRSRVNVYLTLKYPSLCLLGMQEYARSTSVVLRQKRLLRTPVALSSLAF